MELDQHALSSSVRDRAGPLWSVAERFSRTHGLPQSGHTSAKGRLCALAEEVERFLELERVTPDEEHAFVEGAGAMLGLILMEHFPRACHRARGSTHRIRLGTYGYFDPFSAIERALDADEPRRVLMREIRFAEAEYQSDGPISRVVRSLSSALREARPDLHIVEHFDLELSLAPVNANDGEAPIALDLRRAVESTRNQDRNAVDQVVKRLVSMLPGSTPELDVAAMRDRLLPRLSHVEALRELCTRGKSPLFSAPLVGELSVALQVQMEGRARYVRTTETSSCGLADDEAIELAIANLMRRSGRFRLVRHDGPSGTIYTARTGDGLDSARVLLPELYVLLTERLGTTACLGIPHRDTFFACAADNASAVAELRQRTEYDAARAPHRLSTKLYNLVAPGTLVEV